MFSKHELETSLGLTDAQAAAALEITEEFLVSFNGTKELATTPTRIRCCSFGRGLSLQPTQIVTFCMFTVILVCVAVASTFPKMAGSQSISPC